MILRPLGAAHPAKPRHLFASDDFKPVQRRHISTRPASRSDSAMPDIDYGERSRFFLPGGWIGSDGRDIEPSRGKFWLSRDYSSMFGPPSRRIRDRVIRSESPSDRVDATERDIDSFLGGVHSGLTCVYRHDCEVRRPAPNAALS